MTSAAIAESALNLCSQRLLFAGRSVVLKTNCPRVAAYAADFLQEDDRTESAWSPTSATITVHVHESREPVHAAPWFRARGHFAFARFTRSDSFWFNLRTREVYGVCSSALANDRRRWQVHIFPALLGILSAAIEVAPLHAACVVGDGGGILLTGHSGAGKSTLSIALGRRGYSVLSDEWTYLSAAGRGLTAWGLPVPIKLLPDAVRFYPELLDHQPADCLNGETAYEVFPEEFLGVSRQMSCSLNTIILLDRALEPRCDVTAISAQEAIAHLKAEMEPLEGSLACAYNRQLDLIERLADASCLRVSFNAPPAEVAEALDVVLTPA